MSAQTFYCVHCGKIYKSPDGHTIAGNYVCGGCKAKGHIDKPIVYRASCRQCMADDRPGGPGQQ